MRKPTCPPVQLISLGLQTAEPEVIGSEILAIAPVRLGFAVPGGVGRAVPVALPFRVMELGAAQMREKKDHRPDRRQANDRADDDDRLAPLRNRRPGGWPGGFAVSEISIDANAVGHGGGSRSEIRLRYERG